MPLRIPFVEKFPVTALIFQKRGRGLTCFFDKARFIDKEGTKVYELKKYGAVFKPSSFDDFITMMNGKPLIILYEYQRDMLVPVDATNLEEIYDVEDGEIKIEEMKYVCDRGHHFTKPKKIQVEGYKGKKQDIEICPHCEEENTEIRELDNPPELPIVKKYVNLHAIEEDMAYWGQLRRKDAEQRHKDESWIQRNKEFIMMAIVFVFFIIMTYIFMNSISDVGFDIIQAMEGIKGAGPPG